MMKGKSRACDAGPGDIAFNGHRSFFLSFSQPPARARGCSSNGRNAQRASPPGHQREFAHLYVFIDVLLVSPA